MKYQKLWALSILTVFLSLSFSGCSASILPPNDAPGYLRIVIGADTVPAKTISPAFSASQFINYDITIEGTGISFNVSSAFPDFLLDNNTIIQNAYPNGLPYGTYTITVKAYRNGENGANYSAYGSKTFTLGPGVETVVVTISPIISAGNDGALSYKLTGSGKVILLPYANFVPEPDSGEQEPISGTDPGSLPGAITLTVDGNSHNLQLASGYYVLYYNDLIDVVLIYKNFTTEISLNL